MRILWYSAAPWTGTGYGTQTALWTRYLAGLGHRVAIACTFGAPGRVDHWEGMTVYPPPLHATGDHLLRKYAALHKADVVVVLTDVWTLNPADFDLAVPVIMWTPVDCTPLGIGETQFYNNCATSVYPLAMSPHGQEQLKNAGHDPVTMIPHGIDTQVFTPPREPMRDMTRMSLGLTPSTIAVGANFNNIDPYRKATPQLLEAFRRFHVKHRDSVLFLHTVATVRNSLDLTVITARLGITDCVRFCDQATIQAGMYTQADMARWYGAMDVVVNATCGEGFGIPAIEAQACGTPVILADNTTGRWLAGPGLTVRCEPWWNPTHGSWWQAPDISKLAEALHKATTFTDRTRAAARLHAEHFDYHKIGPQWGALLKGITDGQLEPDQDRRTVSA